MDIEGGGQSLTDLTEPPAPHQVVNLVVAEASLGLAWVSPGQSLGGLIWRQFGFCFVRLSG